MKEQMIVMHVESGKQWSTGYTEVTTDKLGELKEFIKSNLSSLGYLEIDGDILPGDFVRNHCILRFLNKNN